MSQWEYKIEVGDLGEDDLNRLGDERWELIDIEHVTDRSSRYHFKREKMKVYGYSNEITTKGGIINPGTIPMVGDGAGNEIVYHPPVVVIGIPLPKE